jgi:hypothetical protein
MKYWEYYLPSNSMWSSFDFGHVKAETLKQALIKAEAEIRYQLNKANAALAANPETAGLNFDINCDGIEIKEVKKDLACNLKE